MNPILKRVVDRRDLRVLEDCGDGVTLRTDDEAIDAIPEIGRVAEGADRSCKIVANGYAISIRLE